MKEKKNPIMDNPTLGHVHAVVTFKDHIKFLLLFLKAAVDFQVWVDLDSN